MSIAENLDRVRRQLTETCARTGRSPETVALMAVSKMHPVESILEAHAAGQRLFGENRVQEMQAKHPHLAHLSDTHFHLIGPLQNNKTSKAAELFHAVDTIDSFKTAQRLDTTCATLGRSLPVLIEVKLSPEESKHGLAPAEIPTLLEQLSSLPHISVTGLMTVPPWSEGPETARPYFRELRRLRDQHAPRFPTLTALSMGMTNDFQVAIEEGSTCIRIGTAIFGKRVYT